MPDALHSETQGRQPRREDVNILPPSHDDLQQQTFRRETGDTCGTGVTEVSSETGATESTAMFANGRIQGEVNCDIPRNGIDDEPPDGSLPYRVVR